MMDAAVPHGAQTYALPADIVVMPHGFSRNGVDMTARDAAEQRIAAARQAELAAQAQLQQLIRSGDQGLREAAGRLSRFDAMLEGVKALLRRAGYLG